MTMDEDREGLAAEYVLGTLDADERAQADALHPASTPEFAAAVRQLGTPARRAQRAGRAGRAAGAGLGQDQGLARRRAAPGEPMRLPDVAAPAAVAAAQGPSAEIIELTQRMRRWRGLTVMTGALAACIVGIVLAREYRPDVLPPDWRPKPAGGRARGREAGRGRARSGARSARGAAGAVRRGVPEGRAVARRS